MSDNKWFEVNGGVVSFAGCEFNDNKRAELDLSKILSDDQINRLNKCKGDKSKIRETLQSFGVNLLSAIILKGFGL